MALLEGVDREFGIVHRRSAQHHTPRDINITLDVITISSKTIEISSNSHTNIVEASSPPSANPSFQRPKTALGFRASSSNQPVQDYLSAHTAMAPLKATPRASGSSQLFLAAPEAAFKIAHQRVFVDVDLANHSLTGHTEIILIPLSDRLEFVTLDCKQMNVTGVIVENRRCDNYIHDDPYRWYAEKYSKGQLLDSPLYRCNSVEQSHFLRNKFSELNHASESTDSNRSQLTIRIPPSVKITLQDANAVSFTPITPSIRTPAQDTIYSPITIRINYELHNPTTGLQFDTSREQSLWNACTTNTELNSSASHWLPCVDTLEEKCTWELEFSIPKKVRDIGTSNIVGASQPRRRRRNPNTPSRDDEHDTDSGIDNIDNDGHEADNRNQNEDDDEEMDEEDEEDNPLNREMVVCCSEFSSGKEVPHPTDLSRKVASFQIFNPVAPHHIGWAVGPFQTWVLPQVKAQEEPEEDPDEPYAPVQNQEDEERDVIPIQIYTLPSPDIDERTILNSTLVTHEILDFYSKEFGSYSFTSYCLLFLPSVAGDHMDFAGATFCNTRLLYPPEVIDPTFTTTDKLTWALAAQWAGVNVTPLDMNDMWCCIGMAGYMALQFSKHLMGMNEFKYRVKLLSEQVVEQDWEKPPMAESFTQASMPISSLSKQLQFIRLKAPIVLYILDRRMTKTERSFGMSRVLPKIFLQAMSGDLPNSTLSTAHFQHVCERVNKNKLENFFKEWVYGSGVPIFRITQRFNKKRMVVEMGIRQCQVQELGLGKTVGEEGFSSSAMNHLCSPNKNLTPVFTGSMTIRIHEADGTPYEHIVELKDTFTKLDIQYNTKYKRLKRRRKINKTAKQEGKDPTPTENPEVLVAEDENEDIVLVNCLGDVLLSAKDCSQWNLTDPMVTSEGDEFQQQNEAFEWIRIDADFEWVCKIYINQPDYMFASQLQQDRDVEAQIDSIRFFEDVVVNSNVNSMVYSSILTRTVMDERYFYGVRIEACRALSRFIMQQPNTENFSGGAKHLIKIFQHYFCYENSNIPFDNDFSDYQRYFLQKAIPQLLAEVRNQNDVCPRYVKRFLLDILRYNENGDNSYYDTHYVVTLITSVVTSALQDPEDASFYQDLLHELRRFKNLDQWIPSYQLLVTKCIMIQHLRLAIDGFYVFDDIANILEYTVKEKLNSTSETSFHATEGLQDLLLTSFEVLLVDGGIKNKEALKLFFEYMLMHPDPYVRTQLVGVLVDSIDFIAGKRYLEDLDDDIDSIHTTINPPSGMEGGKLGDSNIIIENYSAEASKKRETQMRASIGGLITLMRRRFASYGPLKQIIWDSLHSPLTSVYQKKCLFDVVRVIYKLQDNFYVTLPIPRDRRLVAKNIGNGIVKLRREGILKINLAPKIKINSKRKPPISTKSSSVKLKLNLPTSKKSSTPSRQQSNPSINSSPLPRKKPKQVKSSVTKVGALPLRFVKISSSRGTVDVSAAQFNENVKIVKSNARALVIRIKTPREPQKEEEP
ncbi:LAQU0S15e01860g1_1 [Lachancea quebecensis]|uniref:Transcription initiation factor TFIID subunit 2 n=1 Tax=Lachancea quebecensis TaxID=1654605 RepID=A0A0P1KY51_9SACH|nr:LAQU0S15e01860g1_1 [Lachancea quebecensis]